MTNQQKKELWNTEIEAFRDIFNLNGLEVSSVTVVDNLPYRLITSGNKSVIGVACFDDDPFIRSVSDIVIYIPYTIEDNAIYKGAIQAFMNEDYNAINNYSHRIARLPCCQLNKTVKISEIDNIAGTFNPIAAFLEYMHGNIYIPEPIEYKVISTNDDSYMDYSVPNQQRLIYPSFLDIVKRNTIRALEQVINNDYTGGDYNA